MFHKLIEWVNPYQCLTILHTLPILHQFILVKVKPFKDILSFVLWMQN